MREIKFRAWLDSKMITPGFIDSEGRVYEDCIERPEELDGAILMQYTGLKDKNGREIYEGDIVSFHMPGRGIIEWDDGSASFVVVNKWMAIVHFEETNVIGNIYENPELLNGT